MKKQVFSRYAEASFTIEATLLMSIVIPMLMALIFAGFYVHDKAKLQGACCELAARGSCLAFEEEANTTLSRVAAALSKGGTMWARNTQVKSASGEEEVQASASAVFPFLGFTSAFLSQGNNACEETWNRKTYHPAKLIRKVRGLKALQEMIGSQE